MFDSTNIIRISNVDHTQLSMEFIMLIIVIMSNIVGILTFISIRNRTHHSLKG